MSSVIIGGRSFSASHVDGLDVMRADASPNREDMSWIECERRVSRME